MSRSVARAAIDRVLEGAVDAGAVPHVAASAADADGVFFEAGFGPRVAGQGGEVTADTYCPEFDAFRVPMVVDPGSRFVYGVNTDWLGRVVEAVTGTGLDVVVRELVTGPLGMDRTSVALRADQLATFAAVHVKDGSGNWSDAGDIINRTDPSWWADGHGLYSTPRDFVRFERALLRGGEWDGVRILSDKTVDEVFRNQIGELDFPAEIPTADPAASGPLNLGPGYKWGYGLLLNPTDLPGRRRAGTGAWAGLFNTHFWIDRASGIRASIYSSSLPFVNPAALQLYQDDETALYTAL